MPHKKENIVKQQTEDAVREEKVRSYKRKGMSDVDALKAALVSMKREKEEKETPAEEKSEDSYPYGLRLRLEQDDLEKLGLKLPDIGDTFKVVANATVQSVSSNKSIEDDKGHQCVELQITEMKID